MASETFCPFYSKSTSLDCWDFVGPRGTGLANKGGKWNFSSLKTPSNGTGPSEGHTHGYVYCETGSPTKTNSEFTMTTISDIDASASEITVNYWYNCNTDTPILLEVLGWDGFKWNVEDRLQPEDHELGDVWYERTFLIENYENSDCKIRFKVTILEGGKSYKKDFALDSITISVSDTDADNITTFFTPRDIHKRKKFDKVYEAKHKTKQEVDIIVEDFKANINDFDFSKYPDGIVIQESQHIIHHFKEEDKWH